MIPCQKERGKGNTSLGDDMDMEGMCVHHFLPPSSINSAKAEVTMMQSRCNDTICIISSSKCAV